MEVFFIPNIREVKKEKKFLERKLKIKINILGRKVTIQGDPLDEYEASLAFDAMSIGFSASTAAELKNENMIFEKLNIKDFSRKKNLEVIRGRLIGTHGKTKKTIEQIAGAKIKIKDNIIGIIAPAESIDSITTAITNIIRGSKQTNMYKYLERINTSKKKLKNKNK